MSTRFLLEFWVKIMSWCKIQWPKNKRLDRAAANNGGPKSVNMMIHQHKRLFFRRKKKKMIIWVCEHQRGLHYIMCVKLLSGQPLYLLGLFGWWICQVKGNEYTYLLSSSLLLSKLSMFASAQSIDCTDPCAHVSQRLWRSNLVAIQGT